jgi:hypothetical protein
MTAQFINPSSPETLGELYERDFCQWLDFNIARMKSGNTDGIDLEHLIEELEAMGRSERQALQRNLQVVLMYLLKYKYQPERGAGNISSFRSPFS